MLERGMDENEVSEKVAAWLLDRGYKVRVLKAGLRGIDVAAWHPDTGHKWAIEAKGSTSSKKWTKRHGAPASEGAAYNGVSKALLNVISWTGIGVFRDTSLGLAGPDDKWFDMWFKNIEPTCELLGISLFRAGEDAVRVFPDDHGLLIRPDDLLKQPRAMPRSLRSNYPFPAYPDDELSESE